MPGDAEKLWLRLVEMRDRDPRRADSYEDNQTVVSRPAMQRALLALVAEEVAREREACADLMMAMEPPGDQPRYSQQADVDAMERLRARAWYVEGHDDATIEGSKRIRARGAQGGAG